MEDALSKLASLVNHKSPEFRDMAGIWVLAIQTQSLSQLATCIDVVQNKRFTQEMESCLKQSSLNRRIRPAAQFFSDSKKPFLGSE